MESDAASAWRGDGPDVVIKPRAPPALLPTSPWSTSIHPPQLSQSSRTDSDANLSDPGGGDDTSSTPLPTRASFNRVGATPPFVASPTRQQLPTPSTIRTGISDHFDAILAGAANSASTRGSVSALGEDGTPTERPDNLLDLLENNRRWADGLRRDNPGLLERLATKQSPEILWIGCSDSRVPAENIVGLGPGDLFVHRNIANVVVHTDLSMLSVLQYAVDVLHVKHIIVCGHYQCGGCAAAMSQRQYGLIDNWLRNIKDVYMMNRSVIEELEDEDLKEDALVELNVAKSVHNICHTTVVQNAWGRGQRLSVHGWSYRLSDGHIRDLELCINNLDEVETIYSYVVSTGIKRSYREGSRSRERGEPRSAH
ncbi:hypothetical protein HK101_009110 [Irineochytrium annulatum]|nr:hypothetical protein HK101_009110 [Irineochytrium annulatum]